MFGLDFGPALARAILQRSAIACSVQLGITMASPDKELVEAAETARCTAARSGQAGNAGLVEVVRLPQQLQGCLLC